MNYKLSMIVFVVFFKAACGHECKEFNLSASDQTFVDMIKHYLHTSKSEKCPSNGIKSKDVHSQVGSTGYTTKGGGVNYLCLPNDPENGETQPFACGVLQGTEYEMASGWSSNLLDKEVPCSVCRRKGKTSVLVIPGKHVVQNVRTFKDSYQITVLSKGYFPSK